MKRETLLPLALFVVIGACAKAPRPNVAEGPAREVRVLEKNDPALRPVSFAAAAYLKSMAPSSEVGFAGVFHKRELDLELTRDIVIANAFVDLSTPRPASPNDCSAPRTTTTPARAPRDPATGRTTATATQQATPATCAPVKRPTYAFHKFRIAADTAYIETSGLNQGLSCMVLAVKPGGGWTVQRVKPTRPEACGK